MWSKVKTLFHLASHTKTPALDETKEFQVTLVGKSICCPDSNFWYKALIENFQFFTHVHTNVSSSSLHILHSCNLKKNHSTISTSQSLSCLNNPHQKKRTKPLPPKPPWGWQKQIKRENISLAVCLCTTCPSIISLSSHYQLHKQLYYPKCPNPSEWFPIILPDTHPTPLATLPYLEPYHSTRSKMDKEQSSIGTLALSNKKHMKDCLID